MTFSTVDLVFCCVVGSILLLALVVRYIPQHWREGSTLKDSVEHFSALNRTLFSFILALSIVSAGTSLSKAADEVSAESASLTNLYWASRPLSDATRDSVRRLTRQYTATVIDKEWPAMAEGKASTQAQDQYDALRRVLQDASGGSEQEQTFTRDSLVALRAVGDARRARMLAVSQEIPNYLWIGLILSAMFLVAAAAIQIPALTGPGVASIALLTLLVSAVLAVLAAMNHPFGGGVHVEPDAFKLALQRFSVI